MRISICIRVRVAVIAILLSQSISAQDFSNIKNMKPFAINGDLSVGSFFYNSVGRISPLPDYGYSLFANATLSLYGFQFPFYISYNNQENSFQHPFNQFGISPSYKWAKVHLGYRVYNLSQFTLAGKSLYSVGVELNPGKFRFAALGGRFYKSSEDEKMGYTLDRFQRNAYAMKLGVGSQKNYFDLIFFKSEDDINTLPLLADSLKNRVEALDNFASGIKSKFSFLKGKLVYDLDVGISAITEDIRHDTIDYSFNPKLEKYTVIFSPNLSSHLNYAGETALNYTSKYFIIGVKYRRVTPQYKSLGVSYLLTDLENYTITPSLILLKQKLLVSGSYGLEFNNLDGRLSTKAGRNIGSINIDYEPNQKFGLNVNYSNYSIYQQVFKNELSNDSILVNQINHNASITPHYTIVKDNNIQNYLFSINYQILDDKNEFTKEFSNNELYNLLFSYIYSRPKKGISLRLGANYFDYAALNIMNKRKGISIGISKKIGKTGLLINGTLDFNHVTIQSEVGYNYKIGAQLNYIFKKKHALSFTIHSLKNEMATSVFFETRGQLRYHFRF